MNLPIKVTIHDSAIGKLAYVNQTTKSHNGVFRYWRNIIIDDQMATLWILTHQDINSPPQKKFEATLQILHDPPSEPEEKLITLLKKQNESVVIGNAEIHTATIKLNPTGTIIPNQLTG